MRTAAIVVPLSSSTQAATTQVVGLLQPMLINVVGEMVATLRNVGGRVLQRVHAADGEDGYVDVRIPLPKRRLLEREPSGLLQGAEGVGHAGAAAGHASSNLDAGRTSSSD
jgi:hypothetical protein